LAVPIFWRKSFENDNIENDNIKNDNIKNDNIKNDNIENDNIENDNIENDNIGPGHSELEGSFQLLQAPTSSASRRPRPKKIGRGETRLRNAGAFKACLRRIYLCTRNKILPHETR
jgi:hypothetical protein